MEGACGQQINLDGGLEGMISVTDIANPKQLTMTKSSGFLHYHPFIHYLICKPHFQELPKAVGGLASINTYYYC